MKLWTRSLPAVLVVLAGSLAAQSIKISGELEGPVLSQVRSFRVSPTGERVAFLFRTVLGIEGLYSNATNGSSAPTLLFQDFALADDEGVLPDYSFSPDGRWIVFRQYANPRDLNSVASDGSLPVRALDVAERNARGSLSFAITPDSSCVVYVTDDSADGTHGVLYELFIAPIDGRSPGVRLSAGPTGSSVLDVKLSPDGTRAVYRATPAAGVGPDLYSVALDGSSPPLRLNLARPLASVEADYVISRDSLGVAYRQDQDADEVFELFVTGIDGTTTPVARNGPLVAHGDVRSFALAGDDGRLVYLADAEVRGRVELYSVPTFAGAPIKLNGALSGVKTVSDFQLTPGGVRALYRADQNTPGMIELFSVPLDGSLSAVRLNLPLAQSFDDVFDFVFGAGGRVVYRAGVSSQGLGAQLCSVLEDGSAPALDLGALQPVSPGYAISNGGARVCFTAGVETQRGVYSAPLDASSAPVALNDRAVEYGITPIRSAGPERVLYLTGEDHPFGPELYSARGDGAGPSLRLNPPVLEGTPQGKVVGFELTPDFSQVLYAADLFGNGIYELFRRSADGLGPVKRVHPQLFSGGIADYRVTPDSTRAVYRIDHGAAAELFSAPLDGSAPAVRLCPALVGLQSINSFELSHDGAWVVDLYMSNPYEFDALELDRVPVDGSAAPVKLSQAPPGASVSSAWVSGDDRWVVYTQTIGERHELYSVRLDLSAPPVRLNGPLVAGGSVRWHYFADSPISPDSTRVVYGADQDVLGAVELYSAPIDGSAPPTKLSQGAGLLFDVSFSPVFRVTADNARVVYFADPDGDGQFTLFSVPLAGGVAPLALGPIDPLNNDHAPFLLSADSTRAVYVDAGRLFAARLDGSAPPTLLATSAGPRFLTQLALAPDSSRAVFCAIAPFFGPFELFSVLLDGSAPPVRLHGALPAGGNVVPSQAVEFTPDARRVLFIGDLRVDEQFELYSAPLDASAAPRVESGPMVSNGDVSTLGSFGMHFRVSPDGASVYYIADQERDEVLELFAGCLGRPLRRAHAPR